MSGADVGGVQVDGGFSPASLDPNLLKLRVLGEPVVPGARWSRSADGDGASSASILVVAFRFNFAHLRQVFENPAFETLNKILRFRFYCFDFLGCR